jgi:hypothetical protein
VIDDYETIGAADWDYTAKLDINGTTAKIRCAPWAKNPFSTLSGSVTPSRTVQYTCQKD